MSWRNEVMEKPIFRQSDFVEVVGAAGGLTGVCGKIVGKASEHVIDMWIVEADPEFLPVLERAGYPFKCFVIPGTLLELV